MSDIKAIINWFYRQKFPEGILLFDNLLAAAVEKVLEKNGLDRDKYVLANAARVWNTLNNHMQVDKKKGLSPLFSVVDSASRRLTWYPHCTEIGDKKGKWIIKQCSSRPVFIKKFDLLSWREYEALGCVIAELSGANNVVLTPSGNDCGIDFFALIALPGKTHIFSGQNAAIRVVGQSKKYESSLDVVKFGSFVNTLNEVRNLQPKIQQMVPLWFLENNGPIIGWVVSHNGFQSGVEIKARNNGIILSTTIDLAEIAAKSRKLSNHSESEKVTQLMNNVSLMLQNRRNVG